MADDAAAPDGELSDETPAAEDAVGEETTGEEAKGDDEATDHDEAEGDDQTPARAKMSHVRLATILGLVAVVALAGLCGWLGFRAYESSKAAAERNLFLQVGRQAAVNLTTIDFEHADEDVQRVLDSSTGTFYDDFQARAQPFKEVVKQAKSKSVGTIAEAGVESETEDGAEVLVAVNVKTSNAGAAEQEPRSWRMQITVQKVGDEAKVANVRFVS
jgi:Mce-associated membrane protein